VPDYLRGAGYSIEDIGDRAVQHMHDFNLSHVVCAGNPRLYQCLCSGRDRRSGRTALKIDRVHGTSSLGHKYLDMFPLDFMF
jgi:hypothetical protein